MYNIGKHKSICKNNNKNRNARWSLFFSLGPLRAASINLMASAMQLVAKGSCNGAYALSNAWLIKPIELAMNFSDFKGVIFTYRSTRWTTLNAANCAAVATR